MASVIARDVCEAAFRAAVAACDPARHVRDALARRALGGRDVYAIAVGKAALAMARGAGPVARGIAIAPVLDGQPLPLGWSARDAGHPEPDARSVAAADAVLAVIASAGEEDRVLALISGGASALIEKPRAGVTLEQIRAETRTLMARGATIRELNARRIELSAIKGGALAARSAAPVVTFVASDVIGDDPCVIGSGPTAAARPGDVIEVVAPMSGFADAIVRALAAHGLVAVLVADPMQVDVATIADQLAASRAPIVAWGEPTLHVPDAHGEGGRAQQLALELARRLRGGDRAAFVAGSDGIDGPPPKLRSAPAGAYVDGATWNRLRDPDAALARCDAGTALAEIGALFVPGATGINHADIAIVA